MFCLLRERALFGKKKLRRFIGEDLRYKISEDEFERLFIFLIRFLEDISAF